MLDLKLKTLKNENRDNALLISENYVSNGIWFLKKDFINNLKRCKKYSSIWTDDTFEDKKVLEIIKDVDIGKLQEIQFTSMLRDNGEYLCRIIKSDNKYYCMQERFFEGIIKELNFRIGNMLQFKLYEDKTLYILDEDNIVGAIMLLDSIDMDLNEEAVLEYTI